jgi:EAL domain-containing protein (putative c-di-GMP-specific phosphodiesterase class I)
VNVSTRQVMRAPFAPDEHVLRGPHPGAVAESMELEQAAAAAIRRHGLAPGQLELELTETTLMSNAEFNVSVLKRLKAQGVSVSVDDFGTGYSSLAYLKRFPIDAIKIDRSFVRDLAVDPDDAAVVIAIINMAHNLKLRIVAEGVETAEQLAFLRSHGCDEAQGYFIARPTAPEVLAQWFTENAPHRS